MRKTTVRWILRDIAARDEGAAMAFIDEHVGHFSVEALRRALKHAGAATRQRYLRRAAQADMAATRAARSRHAGNVAPRRCGRVGSGINVRPDVNASRV